MQATSEAMADGELLVANGLPLMSDALLAGGADSAASASIRDAATRRASRAPSCPYATALRYGRGIAAGPRQWRAAPRGGGRQRQRPRPRHPRRDAGRGRGRPGRRQARDRAPHQPARRARRPTRRGRSLAALYLDNRYTGRRPREALRLLAGSGDIDARIRAAGLFMDYDEKLEYPDELHRHDGRGDQGRRARRGDGMGAAEAVGPSRSSATRTTRRARSLRRSPPKAIPRRRS